MLIIVSDGGVRKIPTSSETAGAYSTSVTTDTGETYRTTEVFEEATNNQMELLGMLEGVMAAYQYVVQHGPTEVFLVSDSQLVIKGISEGGYLETWRRRKPIEITKELRDQINSKDQIIGQVNKTIEYISSDTGALSSTLESLFGSTGIRTITDLTDRISSEIVTYQPKLNAAISSLTQTASDIAALKANLTSNSSTLTSGATTAKNSSQTILSTTYPASLNTLSANALALLDNLTEVAQDTYNLTTINNIANGKVTTAEYNAFYKKNDQIFSSLQTIVNNF